MVCADMHVLMLTGEAEERDCWESEASHSDLRRPWFKTSKEIQG